MNELSHLDEQGRVKMVNVAAKEATLRTARARSIVVLPQEMMRHLEHGDIRSKKGSVFQAAVIGGIMAAKRTGELIPLCHPLGMDSCDIEIHVNDRQEVVIDCTASITAKTGIEMEAMVGATMAALTIYDMCKAMSHDIVIKETRLIEKTGGKRDFRREE
ncbi:cyclic pyranopterin monophosphate synthase MoaC [Nemorincola caseinilytica]|uniref:Cyclic pyranopterin monophosphate synthase MoaC n=1 Tax=Nemorincola caseinilytica TaxID=2054315 RepID=A0ABP8N7Z3_9BACT